MPWFSFHFDDFAVSFLSVLFEGIPFLLLGSLISGFVDVFVSSERIAKMLPKSPAASILLCGALGLVFPMCECGSVVVVRRFIKKGLPLSSAVTYMLAAPIVSPIVAFSTYAAFKGQDPGQMTMLRLTLGFLVAAAVGFVVLRLPASSILISSGPVETKARRRAGFSMTAAPAGETTDFASIAQAAGFRQKMLLVVQSATADLLDVTVFLIIGAAVASVFNTAVNQEIILPFATNPPVAIASLMVLRSLLSICSTTDAFIIKTFATFPMAAKLAALVYGPLFDFKLFWLYSSIFKTRAVIALGVGLFIVIFLICWRISALNM
ncbi:MAG: permease [Chthoniobacter sp.]|uniref:permease n=1 Tax=Chthoniobacter sp. TaxID=2510640 RepID=UPI0032A72539